VIGLTGSTLIEEVGTILTAHANTGQGGICLEIEPENGFTLSLSRDF